MSEMKDPRQVLINLAASATLADHMGDMWSYIGEALEQIGIEPPEDVRFADDYGHAFAKWLRLNHNATSIYGTEVGTDD